MKQNILVLIAIGACQAAKLRLQSGSSTHSSAGQSSPQDYCYSDDFLNKIVGGADSCWAQKRSEACMTGFATSDSFDETAQQWLHDPDCMGDNGKKAFKENCWKHDSVFYKSIGIGRAYKDHGEREGRLQRCPQQIYPDEPTEAYWDSWPPKNPVFSEDTLCAEEGPGERCECPGGYVYLGTPDGTNAGTPIGPVGTIGCTISQFGDPSPNQQKYCYCFDDDYKESLPDYPPMPTEKYWTSWPPNNPVFSSGTQCAEEGGRCECPGGYVYYGTPDGRNAGTPIGPIGPGGISCSNSQFGDPAQGEKKYCHCFDHDEPSL